MPSLPMIQTGRQGRKATICRDFAVGLGREWAVVVESAGEPF